jgi:hypothetical protein
LQSDAYYLKENNAHNYAADFPYTTCKTHPSDNAGGYGIKLGEKPGSRAVGAYTSGFNPTGNTV